MHERPHEEMPHLKAVVFVRPTRENVRTLGKQLKQRTYGEYHVFFSNVCPEGLLQELAAEDDDELVVQVQEYYADATAVDRNTFALELGESNSALMNPGQWSRSVGMAVDRCVEGITSVLLSRSAGNI